MAHSIKDSISESAATLPIGALLAALMWIPTGLYSPLNWLGFAATVLLAWGLRHMNNGNAMMRSRTWVVPALFFLLSGIFWFLHPLRPIQAGVLLYSFSQFYLLQAYQQLHAERQVVASFFFLGSTCLFFPSLVILYLVYLVSMLVHLRAFTPRTLVAAFIGFTIPLELFAAVVLVLHRPDLLFSLWNQFTDIRPLQTPEWSLQETVNLGFLVLLFLTSCLHFWKTNFNDKIRVRMCFYVLMIQTTTLILLLGLQPHLYHAVFPFLLLESCPIIGHYLVYSKGIVANMFFWLILSVMAALLTYNLWML